MNETIEFNLTPFEQMMESVNVELDDFEIDDVFQEGKRLKKLKDRLAPIGDSFEYDPKMEKLGNPMNEEQPKHFKIIWIIKVLFQMIIRFITGFIRNIGYMKPVKISKYGTVFVNKTELDYCYKTMKVLKDIDSNYNDIVIGFLLSVINEHEKNPHCSFPQVDSVLEDLQKISIARQVESPLVSSIKYGEAMTIHSLNQLSKEISDTINSVIKKIREHKFSFNAKDMDNGYIIEINGKEVYRANYKDPFHKWEIYGIKDKLEDNLNNFTMRLGYSIDDLKKFHKAMVDDINNLKNIGDRKIDSPTYEYMI